MPPLPTRNELSLLGFLHEFETEAPPSTLLQEQHSEVNNTSAGAEDPITPAGAEDPNTPAGAEDPNTPSGTEDSNTSAGAPASNTPAEPAAATSTPAGEAVGVRNT